MMINKTNFLYMSFIQYRKLLAYLKKKKNKQTYKQIKNKNNKNKTTPD